MAKNKVDKLEKSVGDHTAQFIVIWPLLLLVAGFFFYTHQIAKPEDFNSVSISLTLFEIFMIVALAAGFWMIRREAVEKAEEAAREKARECVEEIAQALLEAKLQPIVFRGLTKLLNDKLVEKGLNQDDVDDIMNTLDKEG